MLTIRSQKDARKAAYFIVLVRHMFCVLLAAMTASVLLKSVAHIWNVLATFDRSLEGPHGLLKAVRSKVTSVNGKMAENAVSSTRSDTSPDGPLGLPPTSPLLSLHHQGINDG